MSRDEIVLIIDKSGSMEAIKEGAIGGLNSFLSSQKNNDRIGERVDSLAEEEKPENVIFFILTHGLENASWEYTRDRVKEMIEHQQNKYEWEFIYGGANQDAFAEAGSIGIKAQNSFDFEATGGRYPESICRVF